MFVSQVYLFRRLCYCLLCRRALMFGVCIRESRLVLDSRRGVGLGDFWCIGGGVSWLA